LMNPTTDDTAYFGGIEIIMCTWSARRCPSSIRHSFCSASFRNTSPKCLRNPPYKTLRRHFGIKTTWYLHSHFEWLKLSYSSIQILLDVCLAAHVLEFLGWTPVNVKLLLPPRQSRGNSRYNRLAREGNSMVSTALSLLATTAFLTLPAVIIWGWLRWMRRKKPFTLFSTLSLIGLALATASESLAISMVIYARVKGGFEYYDPPLMRIYAWGMLISLVGLALSAIGVWRPSSLRWHALTCTIGTLLYWLVQAAN